MSKYLSKEMKGRKMNKSLTQEQILMLSQGVEQIKRITDKFPSDLQVCVLLCSFISLYANRKMITAMLAEEEKKVKKDEEKR